MVEVDPYKLNISSLVIIIYFSRKNYEEILIMAMSNEFAICFSVFGY
jgi:hypothetical protein